MTTRLRVAFYLIETPFETAGSCWRNKKLHRSRVGSLHVVGFYKCRLAARTGAQRDRVMRMNYRRTTESASEKGEDAFQVAFGTGGLGRLLDEGREVVV